MLPLQAYILLPIPIVALWALIVKIYRKDWKDAFFVFLAGFTLLLNGIAVHFMIHDEAVPQWMILLQVVLSPTIVPQAYLYFCRQMGTRGSRGIHLALWLLMLLLFVPSISVDLRPFQEPTMCDPVKLMHFNIFSHGTRVYAITIPSVIILLQALLTCLRVPRVVKTLNVYELKFTAGAKFFVLWWLAAIVFIIYTSLIEMDQLRQPTFSWGYYICYTFLISFIFGQIAMGLDLNPLRTGDDEEEVGSMDAFVEANHELAQRARRLFMEEKLYLRQGLVTDDVVSILGTNRTYFTRMMRAEFGMSFNEYVTSERISYSKKLLSQTDKTLEDIAMESGFSNASAYCRVFKRLTSTSPDAWRREHKGE